MVLGWIEHIYLMLRDCAPKVHYLMRLLPMHVSPDVLSCDKY